MLTGVCRASSAGHPYNQPRREFRTVANNSYMMKFGADASSVTKAIAGIDSDMRTLNKVARNADQNFKLTGDTSQVQTKIAALTKITELGEKKVADLQAKLDGLRDGSGELPETAQVKKLQNQLIGAQSDLSSYSAKLESAKKVNAGEDIADGFKKADRAIDSADKSAGSLTPKLKSAGGAMASFVGNLGSNLVTSGLSMVGSLFSGMLGDINEASDGMQKFQSTMQFAGKGAAEIDKVTAASQNYADKTVYDLTTIMNTTAQLGANGVKNYQKLVEASGNLNAAVGGNNDTFGSLAMVMTQTAGAGKLTTDNWNQVADAIPGASMKLQDAMRKNGAFTGNFREAMEDGKISADEFFKSIQDLGMTKVAKEAATSTKTMEGAIGNLQASFQGVGKKMEDAVKPYLTAIISDIAEAVPKVAEQFGKLFSGIKPPKASGNFVEQMFGGMDFGPLISQFQSIGTTISGVFSKMDFSGIQAIASQIMPALTAGFDTFMNVAGPAINNVVTAFGNLWNALQPIMSALASALVPVFKILGGYLGGFFSGVLSAVGDIFNVVAQAAKFLTPVIQFVVDVFKRFAPVLQTLGTILGKIQGAFVGAGKVFGVVGNAIGGVGTKIGSIFSRVGGSLGKVFTNIAAWFAKTATSMSRAGSTIGGIPGKVLHFFSGIGGRIAQTFATAPGKILRFFTGMPGKIMAKFGKVSNIGVNIVKGIARGITSGTKFIYSVIRGFVGNVTSFIKKLFKIHSPSRLMRDEVGTYITQGIGAGMVDTAATSSITRAATGVKNTVLGQFGTGGQLAGFASGIVGGGSFAQSSVGGDTTNSTMNFNITGGDPQRTADAVRKVLRQEGLTR